ncbi:MAG: AsmA-like C-terminal region-containing protein, partial [Bacteroidota bacterium]
PIFKMNMGNNPFEATLNLRTPISDPNIDTKINGVIDLADLSKAFPMEGVQELSGVIDADITAKAKMSDIDREAYESVDMKGDLQITGINYTADGLPPVKIKTLHMGLTPKKAEVDKFEALLGKSDIQATGSIDNILAYLSPEKTMKGTFKVRSEYFNADEWMPAESTEPDAATATVETEPVEVFDRFDFSLDAKVGKIKYDIYELTSNALVGRMNSNDLTIKDFRTKIGNSDLKGKGKITNVMNYVFQNETLYGDVQLFSDYFDLNQFMVETDESATAVNTADEEALEPIVVPDNIDMKIDANFGKLTYTNIDLKNINGSLLVKDQAVKIQDTKADMLGGRINMSGGYDTKQADKPLFDMAYDIERFGFQDVFEKFITVQKLAPIAKFLEGKFNTKMSFKGVLGKDMMPNLSTLTADGFLYTFDGALRNFKPLEKLSGLLDIKALQSLQIKDTKNWFEVKEGKVLVKDFDYSYQGIDMIIGGSHSISQEMDYRIMAKIPRKMLKNNIGQAANKGLDFLNGQASKVGLNIADAEFINVQVNLGGSITSPKVNVKPTGTDGAGFQDQAKQALEETKKQVVDTVKTVVNNAKEEVKSEIKKETDKVVTDVKDKGKEAIDSLLSNPGGAKESVKDIVKDASNPDSLKNNLKDKGEDLKDSAKEGVNKLKNLFGKKKKKN